MILLLVACKVFAAGICIVQETQGERLLAVNRARFEAKASCQGLGRGGPRVAPTVIAFAPGYSISRGGDSERPGAWYSMNPNLRKRIYGPDGIVVDRVLSRNGFAPEHISIIQTGRKQIPPR